MLPAGFAFIYMRDKRDADDAIRGLDGWVAVPAPVRTVPVPEPVRTCTARTACCTIVKQPPGLLACRSCSQMLAVRYTAAHKHSCQLLLLLLLLLTCGVPAPCSREFGYKKRRLKVEFAKVGCLLPAASRCLLSTSSADSTSHMLQCSLPCAQRMLVAATPASVVHC